MERSLIATRFDEKPELWQSLEKALLFVGRGQMKPHRHFH